MKLIFLFSSFVVLASCATNPEAFRNQVKQGIPVFAVHAEVETHAVDSEGDAADDSAIWYNHEQPENSKILATNKKAGLRVYDLNGVLVQKIDSGRINNIDLRQSVSLDNKKLDIAVASNRSNNSLQVYTIDSVGRVSDVGFQPLALPEPYGLCLHSNKQGEIYTFVNDKNGTFQQWQLISVDPLEMVKVDQFKVATQPEGCVVDDVKGIVYLGEEARGVWQKSVQPGSQRILVDDTIREALTADVEGIALYRVNERLSYLVVSSQGDFTYAVYELSEAITYKGSFQVVTNENKGIDGTQETDGIAITNLRLPAPFESGMIVVQDGFNRSPKEAQNFKYIPWESVAKALNLHQR